MILAPPDIELILTSRARSELGPTRPGLRVARAVPDESPIRTPLVTFTYAGGASVPPIHDWQRVAVNVYAATDAAANQLALDVSGWLGGLQGALFLNVQTGIPAPVESRTDPPHRYFTTECLTRKESRA